MSARVKKDRRAAKLTGRPAGTTASERNVVSTEWLLLNNARVLQRAFIGNWKRSRVMVFQADIYDTLPQEFWFHLLVRPPYTCSLAHWTEETQGGFEVAQLAQEMPNPAMVLPLDAHGNRLEVASMLCSLDLRELLVEDRWLEAARRCSERPRERAIFHRKRNTTGFHEWMSFEAVRGDV